MTDATTLTTAAAKPPGPGYEVTITRIFRAAPAVVFDCFTDPVHFAKWWGPLGCQSTIYELDARPGGNLSLRMAGPGYDHVMGGEFVELDRPSRLVFRAKAFEAPGGGWALIHLNTLSFEDLGGATRMTLRTVVEKAEGDLVLGALGGMRAGWGQSFERLGDLVGGGGRMDIEVGETSVLLRRAFDAPRESVWRALTEPGAFAQWWAGGGGVVEQMDVRPGGTWGYRMTDNAGAQHRFWGEYVEVDPPARLVMTQGFDAFADMPVEITLTQEWGRTALTWLMTFPDRTYRDGVLSAGYEPHSAASFDLLAKVLATPAP
jgi:uncharacterized protein YndB with AHSA1/START domain